MPQFKITEVPTEIISIPWGFAKGIGKIGKDIGKRVWQSDPVQGMFADPKAVFTQGTLEAQKFETSLPYAAGVVLGLEGGGIPARGKQVVSKGKQVIQKGVKVAEEARPVFKGFKDLTTKFLEYAKGKTTLLKQEILDFARRPELKKGEADLLMRKLEEFEPKSQEIDYDFFGIKRKAPKTNGSPSMQPQQVVGRESLSTKVETSLNIPKAEKKSSLWNPKTRQNESLNEKVVSVLGDRKFYNAVKKAGADIPIYEQRGAWDGYGFPLEDKYVKLSDYKKYSKLKSKTVTKPTKPLDIEEISNTGKLKFVKEIKQQFPSLPDKDIKEIVDRQVWDELYGNYPNHDMDNSIEFIIKLKFLNGSEIMKNGDIILFLRKEILKHLILKLSDAK